MRVIKISLLTIVTLARAAAAAPGDIWEEPATACYAQADAFCGERAMANCTRFWPQVLECTIESLEWPPPPSTARVDYCVERVKTTRIKAKTCNLCGDPIDETMHCILGK